MDFQGADGASFGSAVAPRRLALDHADLWSATRERELLGRVGMQPSLFEQATEFLLRLRIAMDDGSTAPELTVLDGIDDGDVGEVGDGETRDLIERIGGVEGRAQDHRGAGEECIASLEGARRGECDTRSFDRLRVALLSRDCFCTIGVVRCCAFAGSVW